LTPETKGLWGKMNAPQMLEHVSRQIKVTLGEEKLPSNRILRLFGKTLKKSLISEKPYSRDLPTSPFYKINDQPEFSKVKSELINLVGRFDEGSVMKEPHPIFGKLTTDEWGIATWKHIDHHLRQFGI